MSMPQLLLPRNLSALAALAAKESSRYTNQAVQLNAYAEGAYKATATDGKVAGVIEGTPEVKPEEYPSIPALASAPNGAVLAIIPVADWKAAFKAITKLTVVKPLFHHLAVVMGERETTLVSTDLGAVNVLTARNVVREDGTPAQFAPVEEVFPRTKATAGFWVDPAQLIRLLTAAAAVNPMRVHVQVYHAIGDEVVRPVRVDAQAESSDQTFRGVVMPLSI